MASSQMDTVIDLLIPLLMAAVSCAALAGKQDVYTLLVSGASEGLGTLTRLLPPLVVLLTAVHMLRASGAMELLTGFLSPACRWLGIPPETLPLLLIRPISGSAALAVGGDLMAAYGPDSLIGRTAAIMLGSTETTFYAISVYFGAAGVRRSRYTIPAALLADLTGFLAAAWTARFL